MITLCVDTGTGITLDITVEDMLYGDNKISMSATVVSNTTLGHPPLFTHIMVITTKLTL